MEVMTNTYQVSAKNTKKDCPDNYVWPILFFMRIKRVLKKVIGLGTKEQRSNRFRIMTNIFCA